MTINFYATEIVHKERRKVKLDLLDLVGLIPLSEDDIKEENKRLKVTLYPATQFVRSP